MLINAINSLIFDINAENDENVKPMTDFEFDDNDMYA